VWWKPATILFPSTSDSPLRLLPRRLVLALAAPRPLLAALGLSWPSPATRAAWEARGPSVAAGPKGAKGKATASQLCGLCRQRRGRPATRRVGCHAGVGTPPRGYCMRWSLPPILASKRADPETAGRPGLAAGDRPPNCAGRRPGEGFGDWWPRAGGSGRVRLADAELGLANRRCITA
jgi:hypothetical protein